MQVWAVKLSRLKHKAALASVVAEMRYPENSKIHIHLRWCKCGHCVQRHSLFSVIMVHLSFIPVWFHQTYHILDVLGSDVGRKLIVKCRIFELGKQDVLIFLYGEDPLFIPQILVDCRHTRQILCVEILALVLFFFCLFATFLPEALLPAPQHHQHIPALSVVTHILTHTHLHLHHDETLLSSEPSSFHLCAIFSPFRWIKTLWPQIHISNHGSLNLFRPPCGETRFRFNVHAIKVASGWGHGVCRYN